MMAWMAQNKHFKIHYVQDWHMEVKNTGSIRNMSVRVYILSPSNVSVYTESTLSKKIEFIPKKYGIVCHSPVHNSTKNRHDFVAITCVCYRGTPMSFLNAQLCDKTIELLSLQMCGDPKEPWLMKC